MTLSITVFGVVQGVGYRPFVAGLARKTGVTGIVRNRSGIVEITVSGAEKSVRDFSRLLHAQAPDGAVVLEIREEPAPERQFDGFRITESSAEATAGEGTPLFPPDLPMCAECARELSDPQNRRYGYPFISCASCGPRYSILNALPYDRETTTMEDFPMCPACGWEYREGRRRHAQTISCPNCGPQLLLRLPDSSEYEKQEALERGIALLKAGAVLAVKGVGGYQYVCSPDDPEAVERLRLLKGREKKPFAVMFPSAESVREACAVSPEEESLLTSAARPIVLLHKQAERFCPGVCGESRYLGAFLPCMGLHQLLTDACGPLIVTSGNQTTEPICYEDGEVLGLDSPYLSGVLYHTRRIVAPQDDSVARYACGTAQILRRSRGYVPLPVVLGNRSPSAVFAAGGDLKSSFCLLKGDRAFVSQYFGDLESARAFRNYREGLARMERIFGIRPNIVACDMHPGYLSARFAESVPCRKLVKIQHHHAHAASVMAEHRLDGCIGVVFDGTGYGTDGTVWGGEFLLCRGAKYRRAAHLSPMTLCGGDESAKNAALLADCYRYAAGRTDGSTDYPIVEAALEQHINTRVSSSAGRLFDAVSAMLGIRNRNTYEGECAIALENAAASAKASGVPAYPLRFRILEDAEEGLRLDQAGLAARILEAAESGAPQGSLALGFHEALADAVAEVCRSIREQSGENRVALSGGVFANLLLLQGCYERLRNDGFSVFLNSAVPSNDGGISLGQAWLCAQEEEPGEAEL